MYNFSLLNPSDTTETQTPARDVHVILHRITFACHNSARTPFPAHPSSSPSHPPPSSPLSASTLHYLHSYGFLLSPQ